MYSCNPKKPQTNCDKQQIIQKCLNILSKDEHQYKSITMISNEIANNDMKLYWLNSPVKFEQNDLKDIRGLADTGKL